MFFLGKLDLNYVWLQLGTIGRKTGWSEFLGSAEVARQRAQTEPGARTRASRPRLDRLHRRHQAATRHQMDAGRRNQEEGPSDGAAGGAVSRFQPFVQAEAMFGLWDMQVRERNMADAVVTARALAEDFPDNQELAKFLANHDARANFTNAAIR